MPQNYPSSLFSWAWQCLSDTHRSKNQYTWKAAAPVFWQSHWNESKFKSRFTAEAVINTHIFTHTTTFCHTHRHVHACRHIEIHPILEIKDKPEKWDLDLGGGAAKSLNLWETWLLDCGSSPSLLYWDEARNKVTWAGVWEGKKAKFNYWNYVVVQASYLS